MSEEEILNILQNYLNKTYTELTKVGAVGIPDKQWYATEELIKLYNKEKEKNKRLEKFIENGEYTWKQKYNETFEYFKKELEKEKEKNKILLQCLKDSQERCENEHLFLGNPDM